MNRQEKEQVIKDLKDKFQSSQASFLVNYQGLNVAQVADLRNKLRDQQGSFKVAKVTLIRRVAQEVPAVENLKPFLKEQIGLVFAENESPAVAKVLNEFAKKHKHLGVLAGLMDANLLSKESVEILANLPSREVLLATVAGTLNAPISSIVRVLNMLVLRLLFVLKEIEKKKA